MSAVAAAYAWAFGFVVGFSSLGVAFCGLTRKVNAIWAEWEHNHGR